MNFIQLTYLVDLAQTNSIRQTAEHYYVSRQAVSKCIKQLEEELGVALFVRHSSGVALTDVGVSTVNHAKTILSAQRKMLVDAKEQQTSSQNQNAVLQIVSASVAINAMLPNIYSHRHSSQLPIMIQKITEVHSLEDMVSQLLHDGSNLGLASINTDDLSKLSSYSSELSVVILATDRMVAVVNKNHKQAQSDICTENLEGALQLSFNILPLDQYKESEREASLINSGDVEFHQSMIRKHSAIVLMSGFAQKLYFNSKQFSTLPNYFCSGIPQIAHIAVFRKQHSASFQPFIEQLMTEISCYI